MTVFATCGTYAGANAHKKYSDPTCAACRKAAADYAAWWRFKTGQQRSLRQCMLCGSVFAKHVCSMVEIVNT